MRNHLIICMVVLMVGITTARATVPSYYAPVNDVFPGYGPDSSPIAPELPVHEAMGYGLFVSSFINDGMLEDAKRAAEWLIENNDLDNDGKPGWGLPFPWDAFSDGSVNPAHLEYGITTAIAVQGLIDLHIETSEAAYLDAAEAALESYAEAWTGQYFAYSTAPTDTASTHNVSAMLMGQYARAARLTGRDDFQRIADKAYRYLMSKRLEDATSIRWYYIEGHTKMNDLVHAAYIVRGLIDYKADDVTIQKAMNHIETAFFRDGIVYDTIDSDRWLARVWGIGAAIHLACELGISEFAETLTQVLPQYKNSSGAYRLRPAEGGYAPRLQAHVAWGLSSCNE